VASRPPLGTELLLPVPTLSQPFSFLEDKVHAKEVLVEKLALKNFVLLLLLLLRLCHASSWTFSFLKDKLHANEVLQRIRACS
jgi:hypothetical protein